MPAPPARARSFSTLPASRLADVTAGLRRKAKEEGTRVESDAAAPALPMHARVLRRPLSRRAGDEPDASGGRRRMQSSGTGARPGACHHCRQRSCRPARCRRPAARGRGKSVEPRGTAGLKLAAISDTPRPLAHRTPPRTSTEAAARDQRLGTTLRHNDAAGACRQRHSASHRPSVAIWRARPIHRYALRMRKREAPGTLPPAPSMAAKLRAGSVAWRPAATDAMACELASSSRASRCRLHSQQLGVRAQANDGSRRTHRAGGGHQPGSRCAGSASSR